MKKLSILIFALLSLVTSLHAHDGDLVKVGARAPTFTGTDSNGKHVSLKSYKGRVVLVDFFATWCGACLEEMPLIQSDIWNRDQAAGLVVIAIGREHQVPEMAKFKRDKGIGFTLLADPNRAIYSKYATEYIPRCYVIDQNGIIRFASVGYEKDEFAKMKTVIADELLKK